MDRDSNGKIVFMKNGSVRKKKFIDNVANMAYFIENILSVTLKPVLILAFLYMMASLIYLAYLNN